MSGTAAAITRELDALVFTPTAGSGTTTFTLTDTTSVGTSASNATTTVTVEPVSVSTFLADQSRLDQTAGGFTIFDTAANITANLDQLNDPNIDAITISDNGQVGPSVQQLTSDATAIGKLQSANGSSVLLAVSDNAGDIEAGLSTLVADTDEIASIAASNGPVVVSTSTFLADQSTLDKIVGGFAISGAAAAITANLDQLNDPNVVAITISDNGQVGPSVQQLTSDATAIGKLQNANGSPVLLAVSDNAGDIETGLSTLVADTDEIASIAASNGPVAVSVATFLADQPTLDKIVGGFAISGATAAITTNLDQLNDPNIDAITISDNGQVGPSVQQLSSDATAIGKLENLNASPVLLAVSDNAGDIEAGLSTLAADTSEIASIAASNGPVVVSPSTFLADQPTLDKIVGGFTISDTAADVVQDLDALNADLNITSIAASNGPVAVSMATFLGDQPTLDKIVGGFAISGAAAAITANLDQLNDPNIDAITILDNGQVGPSVQQLTSDATAIGKLQNANGSPVLLAVSDNAGDIEAGLSTLVADTDEIASIAASNRPVVVSTSRFLADQSTLDKIVGGFAVSDSAADVVQDLSALSADTNITSIAASNGPVEVSAATFLADQPMLDKIVSGFDISGAAAAITANLNQLNDPNIDAITISDNGQVAPSVPQLTADATAIGKLENAGSGPVRLAVSDTAADIEAGLSTLVAEAGEIASITASNGPVGVSVATLLADQSTLDKMVGGFAISGAAAAITANLNQLNDPNIDSITISDNGQVAPSVQQLTTDATAISKLGNAGSGPVLLAVSDTAADIETGLSTLVAEAGEIASITASNGPVAVSAATFLADQPTLDKIVGGFAISDTAADVPANLNALNSDSHVTSIALTDGGTPVLTISIAEALNDTRALSEITSLHTIALADTAADIELITSTQAAALKTDGYASIASTSGPVAMTIAEAETLSGDGIAVTGAPVTASGTVAVMTALSTTEASTLVGQGYSLAVLDTAADIRAMTTTQIAALPARHITQINSGDTTVLLSPLQVAALEAAGMKVSAPPNDTVLISGTAANLEALTASQISLLTAIGASGLATTNANVSYTCAP